MHQCIPSLPHSSGPRTRFTFSTTSVTNIIHIRTVPWTKKHGTMEGAHVIDARVLVWFFYFDHVSLPDIDCGFCDRLRWLLMYEQVGSLHGAEVKLDCSLNKMCSKFVTRFLGKLTIVDNNLLCRNPRFANDSTYIYTYLFRITDCDLDMKGCAWLQK